jgi:hypothetical protein
LFYYNSLIENPRDSTNVYGLCLSSNFTLHFLSENQEKLSVQVNLL